MLFTFTINTQHKCLVKRTKFIYAFNEFEVLEKLRLFCPKFLAVFSCYFLRFGSKNSRFVL